MRRKGSNRISISNITDSRINRIKKRMTEIEPEKYPEIEGISYNTAVSWILDKLKESKILA